MATARRPERRERSVEEKMEIVKAARRGDLPIREVAKKYGCSVQLIYNWEQRLKDGEGLDPRKPGPPPRNKALLEAGRKGADAVLADSKAATKREPSPLPEESLSLCRSQEPRAQQIEIALLRKENKMLREFIDDLLKNCRLT